MIAPRPLKRLLFIVAFVPFTLYACLLWIATGSDGYALLERFERWRDE